MKSLFLIIVLILAIASIAIMGLYSILNPVFDHSIPFIVPITCVLLLLCSIGIWILVNYKKNTTSFASTIVVVTGVCMILFSIMSFFLLLSA